MIQFVLGAALGVAGFNAYHKKKKEDPEFNNKMINLENKLKDTWHSISFNVKKSKDGVFKNVISELKINIEEKLDSPEIYTPKVFSKFNEKYNSIKLSDIEEPKMAWELFILYINIVLGAETIK